MKTTILEQMEQLVRQRQQEICAGLSTIDGTAWTRDAWTRAEGGGGVTCVIQNGDVFEKAGVAVSMVHGALSPEAARAMVAGRHLAEGEALHFRAAGISLVLHPHNPFAPTVHANYRYFERGDAADPAAWWFGGGADLTPSYLYEEDAVHFHRVHKEACDGHDPQFYPRFKRWCDDYFRIVHRGESRGIGGIFFDDLHEKSPQSLLAFVSDLSAALLPAYLPVVQRRCRQPYTDEQKRWQQLRRGRYVEFNLVYDRGTIFGLKTQGRVESILMSLPVTARWEYGHTPAADSPEAALVAVLQKPREWLP